MSELLTAAAGVAPVFAAAATTLGSAVAGAAVQRVADGTVATGEGFLRRLFRRDDGTDPVLDVAEGEVDERRADELLSGLDLAERRLLAQALATWLGESGAGTGALDPERLKELVRAAEAPSTTHVAAYGPHSMAVGRIGDNATFNLGGGQSGSGS
ncbi:hypothetical protein [Streptomyces sp. NPDC021012]|uniref:hypothetical protein n=1 Tax=unclassified Streptomyces TaxID=2593676 RepID=UPI0037AFE3DC